MRKVFFSFHYERDYWRVSNVRNCNVISGYDKNPFYDKAGWEKIKRNGDQAIENWIEKQLNGTSVTIVLIGRETSNRRWVKHEIERSVELGKGLIGIDISKIKDQYGKTDNAGVNPLPAKYKKYLWNNNNGRDNLGKWIEKAAQDAGY
ncbi:MAG: TIR domain-containing protein [Candidatus Aenigmarchaeota archaeon]|nr:TIR domain-containing protein [Candidatus Aenigmarchaeota archaeon]